MVFYRSRNKRRSERGASGIEMAIALPLFLILALALIDLGVIFSRRALIGYAHFRAARAGNMHATSCAAARNAADQAYGEWVTKLGNLGYANFIPNTTRQVEAVSTHVFGPGSPQIRGLAFEGSYQINCFTCGFWGFIRRNFLEYTVRLNVPLQDPDSTQTADCS